MSNRWILCMLSLIVLSGSAWLRLTAQVVQPDSAVMLKDSRTGDVGFVIPKLIAIDYRNLLVNTLPLMEGQIDSLKLDVEKHKSLVSAQKEEIGLLKSNLTDAELKFNAEQMIRQACEQELKKKNWWQCSTYALGAALVGVLIFK